MAAALCRYFKPELVQNKFVINHFLIASPGSHKPVFQIEMNRRHIVIYDKKPQRPCALLSCVPDCQSEHVATNAPPRIVYIHAKPVKIPHTCILARPRHTLRTRMRIAQGKSGNNHIVI